MQTINWDSSWQELDLVFGIAINRDGSEQLLEPADYGVTPDGGVQFTDVILLGSNSADRVYAGFNNYIDAKGGNDILFSIDNYTGNQIVGGTGSDTFFLQTTNNLILGGEIFADSESHGLSREVALTDFEADAYFIDSSSGSAVQSQSLKIYDFEVGRDSLFIDGLKVETSDWDGTRELLRNYNIAANAAPESTHEVLTISLFKGVTTIIDLAPNIYDLDNDTLRVIKLTGPDWISLNGAALTLTANAPAGISEEELGEIDLQIGVTDNKAIASFVANLTFKNSLGAARIADVNISLDENIDTSQTVKLTNIFTSDDGLGYNTITLSGDDADVFEIKDNALFLKAGTSLDFETKSSYNIKVNTVTNDDIITAITPFSLSLINANEGPVGNLSITGISQEGSMLNAVTSNIFDQDGDPLSFSSFQWQVSSNGLDNWSDIENAINSFFFIPDDQSLTGQFLRLEVTATDPFSATSSFSSAPTPAIVKANTEQLPVNFGIEKVRLMSNGIALILTEAPDLDVFNLYDGPDASADQPDLLLLDAAGNSIALSAHWQASSNELLLLTSNPLAAGDYSLNIDSRSDGLISAASGELLDGNRDGTPGDALSLFFSHIAPEHLLSVADTARGAGQQLSLNGTGTHDPLTGAPRDDSAGLPIHLSTSSSLYSFSGSLSYDQELLLTPELNTDPTQVLRAGSDLPDDWTLSIDPSSQPGELLYSATGSTAITGSNLEILRFQATVSSIAAPPAQGSSSGNGLYGSTTLIQTTFSSDQLPTDPLTGMPLAIDNDPGLIVLTYAGDTTGNGTVSSLDASRVQRVVVELDSGFDAYDSIDPVLIGDTTGNGTLSSLDASRIQQQVVGLPVNSFPDLPIQPVVNPLLA